MGFHFGRIYHYELTSLSLTELLFIIIVTYNIRSEVLPMLVFDLSVVIGQGDNLEYLRTEKERNI